MDAVAASVPLPRGRPGWERSLDGEWDASSP